MKFKLSDIRFLIWPAVLGALISIAPLELLTILLLLLLLIGVWVEWRFARRNGFRPLVPVRLGTVVLVVIVANFAPVKDDDRTVDPRRASFVETPSGLAMVEKDQRLYFYFPPAVAREQIALPDHPLTFRDLIKHVERKTGLVASIGYCGTGASILFGASQMGGVEFRPAQQSAPEDALRAARL